MEYISLIEGSTKNIAKEEFIENLDTQHAVIRRIEIIGEAVKNISDKLREKHPEIEWKKITGARDLLIHAYFKVDYNLIWEIIKTDIPVLKKDVKEILKDIEKEENG
jgi:uncharacterized protein with HEPN domain